jgi:hypothetical protein
MPERRTRASKNETLSTSRNNAIFRFALGPQDPPDTSDYIGCGRGSVYRGAPERGPGNYTSGRATELQICTSKLHTQKLQTKTETVNPEFAQGGEAAMRKLWSYSFCLDL